MSLHLQGNGCELELFEDGSFYCKNVNSEPRLINAGDMTYEQYQCLEKLRQKLNQACIEGAQFACSLS